MARRLRRPEVLEFKGQSWPRKWPDFMPPRATALCRRSAAYYCAAAYKIIVPPGDRELQIDVRGDLAGIVAVALKSKTPVARARGSHFEMVAGTGFEPVTFRL